MRKIESFALKYNKTIALINVAVTLLMGIASLFVSYNALIVSKNQEELFKLQMQYLEAENTPQFSLGDISENEDYIIYNIVGNGAIINEARLNPTTIMTVLYKNEVIGRIDVQCYDESVRSFDYATNSFIVHKHKDVRNIDNVWNDICQTIAKKAEKNKQIDIDALTCDYDEVFFIDYKDYKYEQEYCTYVILYESIILVNKDNQYTTPYAPDSVIFLIGDRGDSKEEQEILYIESVGLSAESLYNNILAIDF